MVNRLSPEQVERNEHGVAACRAVVDAALARREKPADDEPPPTRSDELLLAARRRAALDRLRRQTPAIRTRKEQP
ncbi:hypothetical protein [Micromonospora inyonensis]|uniref:Uncharacterized protein n=1 Tax=Micromonospora inyonensis TaxID=47866 RepID=A0A1C6RWP2_9ACTN|nr:hypothetical protein [Micromonospora inyonensis]SCL12800.1 hypothetical protein GA0074694_0002 [Micromonospora inyonensis]SCL21639.1 hypothetical protein GA0074694_3097 [Micromonospora inyonensis]